jgi:hypothetical protein
MLALPLTPTSPRVHFELDCASRTTSLPPTMGVPSYERPSSPSLFTPAATTQSRVRQTSQTRPKLSLQTSSLPLAFGKSSTALAITASALPTASPTLLNTFNNAYEIPHRFSPVTASPTGTRSARPSCRLVSPFASSKEDRPYQVPLGLKGILRNSPMSSSLRKSSFCPTCESPRTGRRAFFPAAKKVTFRTILEEEIRTATYVAKHSDLSSDEEGSDSDECSELSLSSSDDESVVDETPDQKEEAEISQPRKKRKARSNRQIEAAAIRDCVGSAETIPKRLKPTFGTKRKRRRRQWEWTLEPLKEPGTQVEDLKLQVGSSHLSPSQIPLPLSATLGGAEALPSPSKIPLPKSATSPTTSEDKTATPLPSPARTPLTSSATLPSPPLGNKPVKDEVNVAAGRAQ